MNHDPLEVCLENLKSSSQKPDTIDGPLEERMMDLNTKLKKKGNRMRRVTIVIALLLVSGSGFVALGGDSAVMNYIAPSTEKDALGNPVPYEIDWGRWLHRIHDHLWEHFHGSHDKGGT